MTLDQITPRLALPLLQPGQAQKESDHNEALLRLDLATQAGVMDVGANNPPSAPTPGDCWIVGAAPTGDWNGQAGALAGWTVAGWRFVAPGEGMAVWDRASGTVVRFVGREWQRGVVTAARFAVGGKQVIGSRQAAIGSPTGGGTVDGEGRAAIAAILAALRAHGLIDAG